MRPTALVAAVVVAILAASCQASPSPSATSPSSPTGNPAPGGSPVAAATEGPATVPTSETLVAAALEAGSITYEQSLLYRALALFDSPGLPNEFRSPIPDMNDAMELFAEVDDHEAELSTATLEQLAPYRVRPADSTSVFNSPAARRTAGVTLVVATTTTWRHEPAAGGAVNVWVADSPDAASKLKTRAEEVTQVWDAFPDVFGYPEPDLFGVPDPSVNPDAAIDIYYVDASALDPRRVECITDSALPDCVFGGTGAAGYAQRAELRHGEETSGYIVMDIGRTGDAALFELAHEIAHTAQFGIDNHESDWLMESSATWVAYRIMKKLGKVPQSAYGWLPAFFQDLDTTLTTPLPKDAYGAWLYFQFAAMEEGDDVVQQMWNAASPAGVQGEKAVDGVFPFADHFAEFALRNWNKEPVPRRYRTAPDTTFPNLQPELAANETVHAGETYAVVASLPPLSAAYYSYVIDQPSRKIEFKNPLVGRPGFHLWAIKNINETWQAPEDWTIDAEKKFCRDVPSEDVSQIVLIVSNSSLTDTLQGGEAPTVAGKASGCGDWRGTMTGTHTWSTLRGSGQATSTFEGIWTETENKLAQPCQAEYLGAEACAVYLPEGTIKWTWHSTQNELGMNCEQTTGGSVPAGGNLHLDAQLLVLEPVKPDGFAYWGNGQVIVTPATCWAAVESNSQQPPPFFTIGQGSSATNPPSVGNTCYSSTWEIDPTGETITGACVEYDYGYNSIFYEWHLTRIGPPPGGG